MLAHHNSTVTDNMTQPSDMIGRVDRVNFRMANVFGHMN